MWLWMLGVVGTYLSVGVALMFFFLQTPYADNAIWKMILLWPLL